MNKILCTVYDSAAGAYLDPFVAPSPEFAIREFRSAVNTDGHQFNKFPEDYTLFQIGTFSAEDGRLEGCDPHNLGVAVTFLDQPKSAGPLTLNQETD